MVPEASSTVSELCKVCGKRAALPGSDLCKSHDNQMKEERRRQAEQEESDMYEMEFVG